MPGSGFEQAGEIMNGSEGEPIRDLADRKAGIGKHALRPIQLAFKKIVVRRHSVLLLKQCRSMILVIMRPFPQPCPFIGHGCFFFQEVLNFPHELSMLRARLRLHANEPAKLGEQANDVRLIKQMMIRVRMLEATNGTFE
jgi:hypothetical protein